MQDNIDTDNPSDVFGEYIKQKLEDYQLPVDESVWIEIEARMNAGKRKKIVPFWWWFSGGAAVAMLALLFTLLPVHDSTPELAKRNHKNANVQLSAILHKVSLRQSESTIRAIRLPLDSRMIAERAAQKQPEESKEQIIPIVDMQSEAPGAVIDTIAKSNVMAVEEKISSIEVKDSVGSIQKKKYKSNRLIAKNADYTVPEAKTKSEWLLAATIGSGGGTTLSGSTNPLYTADLGNKNIVSAQTSYTNILTPNDFSEKNFMAPLSFGLIVRKGLNKSLSVESGLVYTYLLSTFSLSNYANYDASLKLHYLGIPVNLVVQIWKIRNWELYVSGGVMVEKGLQSVYVQNQRTDYQTITTIAKTSIDGWQWSINTGLGATYKIQRNIGIYFEPKFSCFFDNNQPISARTEQPVVVGLTAGIRYQFK